LITAPVLTLVENMDNDIPIGLGKCVAQMFAAQIYKNHRGFEKLAIYGAVSTGTNCKFPVLEDNLVKIDLTQYFITQLDRIHRDFKRTF
jgi:hypothetical protein